MTLTRRVYPTFWVDDLEGKPLSKEDEAKVRYWYDKALKHSMKPRKRDD